MTSLKRQWSSTCPITGESTSSILVCATTECISLSVTTCTYFDCKCYFHSLKNMANMRHSRNGMGENAWVNVCIPQQ